MRTLLVAGALILVVAVGGFFGWTALADAQAKAAQAKIVKERDDIWKEAIDKVSTTSVVNVVDGSITFQSARKRTCDAGDYPKYDPWLGEVTDWDALQRCRDMADAAFAKATIGMMSSVETFVDVVGIPPAFKSRLGSLRGLDGTQESDFPESKAGPLHVAYSYDGSNGLFVQVERSK